MKLPQNILYVGVNDHQIDLFEGLYVVPNGMSYNSYMILDEKTVVMDSVDHNFAQEWLQNIKRHATPDYLVVQHMEPDHSGSIAEFMQEFPNATIVASKSAFAMMKNFFGCDFEQRRIVVGENSTLQLGAKTLVFVTAPMVHWPEVVVTYVPQDKLLFSADAFGKFGALDVDEEWACEARRYYFGIVGKYGVQVQNLLKKMQNLQMQTICPLHGPVLDQNLPYYLNLYNTWSSYQTESQGVLICYTSVYGNTKKAVLKLASLLEQKGTKVVVNDLARSDMAECVEDAFRYGKIVLATTTYNNDIFPFMKQFIHHLTERNFQNKTIAFVENGSWAPVATKIMKGMLENCKNLAYTQSTVKILSALSPESNAQLEQLAQELAD